MARTAQIIFQNSVPHKSLHDQILNLLFLIESHPVSMCFSFNRHFFVFKSDKGEATWLISFLVHDDSAVSDRSMFPQFLPQVIFRRLKVQIKNSQNVWSFRSLNLFLWKCSRTPKLLEICQPYSTYATTWGKIFWGQKKNSFHIK